MTDHTDKTVLMFYENNTFTSKGVNSVFNDNGAYLTMNGMKIIRNTVTSNKLAYTPSDLMSTKEIWLLGVDKSKLTRKIKELINENEVKVIQIDMKSIAINLQASYNDKNSKNLRLERKGLRKGVILGILNALSAS